MAKKLSFETFSTADLKQKIIKSSNGGGGFRVDVKIKALKELIKRQRR